MLRMKRIEGPACPECGCEDSQVIARGSRWGKPTERRLCNNCGRTFTADVKANGEKMAADSAGAEPIIYQIIKCPRCGSEDTYIAHTCRPVRYHKCRACDATFKSVEK